MVIDFDKRTVSLGAGDFAAFALGPAGVPGQGGGLWRAQLGSHWHREYQRRTLAENPAWEFEVPVSGAVFHRGWTVSLSGRLDQRLPSAGTSVFREIKTVLRTLPAPEPDLRAEYPAHFLQLSAYRALVSMAAAAAPATGHHRWELVFVEADTGLAQTVLLDQGDAAAFLSQLDRLVAFLDSRRQARERLRHLLFSPPFENLRPGQEHAAEALERAIGTATGAVLFEAPTGFGKTGIILEASLAHLRQGHFERLVYLTSKATGQLQVRQTLARMFEGTPAGLWVVRPKSEHCIHTRFHCVRNQCPYLDDLPSRWQRSGLARFVLDPDAPRELESLREAGREARLCPYEITRAALACNDVWIGDVNYVFSPAHRSLFFEQPAFLPARTLLIVDEAHNLPSRVADVYSHAFYATDAEEVRSALLSSHATPVLLAAWDQWLHFLQHCRASDRLSLSEEDDAIDLLRQLARTVSGTALDYAALEPGIADRLWQIPSFIEQLDTWPSLPRHWWSPAQGALSITCLDAAEPIGNTLGEFGGVVLASATFGPHEVFGASLGLQDHAAPHQPPLKRGENNRQPPLADADATPPARLGTLTKRETKKLFAQVTRASDLLRTELARESLLVPLRAETPWRTTAYMVACDVRADTSFQHREAAVGLTARAIAEFSDRLRATPSPAGGTTRDGTTSGEMPAPHPDPVASTHPLVVFFPSFGYASRLQQELATTIPPLTIAMQPRGIDLAGQNRWLTEALNSAEVIFLVLGSSFAEGIDMLGGCIGGAMVVGPALPEVNALQRARLGHLDHLGRAEAVRRVYQIPGMQKVNQALGRLVRAPGHKARVLLHCRRFADPSYQALLHPDFRASCTIDSDEAFRGWLLNG